MILIPAPPRPPLSQPGDTLEGTVTSAEKGTDQWGNDVLKLQLRTPTGIISYTCNRRLWALIGGGEVGRIRITRIEDSPAVGTRSPARNWEVQRLPDQVDIPAAAARTPQAALAW